MVLITIFIAHIIAYLVEYHAWSTYSIIYWRKYHKQRQYWSQKNIRGWTHTAAPKSRHGTCYSLCSISQLCKRTNAFRLLKFVVTASLEFRLSCQSYRCSSCLFIKVKIIWNRLTEFVLFFVCVRCHINRIFSIAFRWSLVIVQT